MSDGTIKTPSYADMVILQYGVNEPMTDEEAAAVRAQADEWLAETIALQQQLNDVVMAGFRMMMEEAAAYAEAIATIGSMSPRLQDTWSDSEGCWADKWYEEHGEYLGCDEAPDPDSTLGLCTQHELMMQHRTASAE
jgi:hypothetical protein